MIKKILLLSTLIGLFGSISGWECLKWSKSDNSEKPASTLSKEEFEIMLASKTQLLKARTEQFESLIQGMAAFKDSPEDDPQVVNWTKSEMRKFLTSLNALVNNYYIGTKAQQFYELAEKNSKSAAEELNKKFEELQAEIRSDIEIAKSLQIDVWRYDAVLKDYNWYFIAVSLALSGAVVHSS